MPYEKLPLFLNNVASSVTLDSNETINFLPCFVAPEGSHKKRKVSHFEPIDEE